MYRTNENSKPNDLEQDENYEFSGATLKISSGDFQMDSKLPNDKISDNINSQSAILSDIDSTPPIQQQSSGSTDTRPQQQIDTRPKIGSPAHFFSFRSGQFERAVTDCINILLRPKNDVKVLGSWLLTEISHWDHERERLYILTTKSLLEVKYDFIALRILDNIKICVQQIDTILKGKITYPEKSLMPIRDDSGVRIMWNGGKALPIFTSWNPFAKDIPWKTIKDHPLFGYKDIYNSPAIKEGLENRDIYSVENLYQAITKALGDPASEARNPGVRFEEGPIILENYVGIGAAIHNKNNFGFFKVRGKFSF